MKEIKRDREERKRSTLELESRKRFGQTEGEKERNSNNERTEIEELINIGKVSEEKVIAIQETNQK